MIDTVIGGILKDGGVLSFDLLVTRLSVPIARKVGFALDYVILTIKSWHSLSYDQQQVSSKTISVALHYSEAFGFDVNSTMSCSMHVER